MSAILAILSAQHGSDDLVVGRMLRAMGMRGDRMAVRHDGQATLAVARHEWELAPGFAGPVLLLHEDDCIVAADATLYYADDLRRRVEARGVRVTGATPSHLALAAYRAFGERCTEVLEGDFAFVVWDRRERRLFATRDFVGTRPLFVAEFTYRGEVTLVLASSIAGVLAHPGCPRDLDLAAVATDAAGLIFTVADETPYRAVRRVKAGTSLAAAPSAPRRSWQHWTAPAADRHRPASLEEGALELRELIGQAVVERLDPNGRTGIWLSGGWDSTAVFGAGQHALSQTSGGDRLAPISMSLPADDPMCETERIVAAADRWGQPIRWVHSTETPLFDGIEQRARGRDEPWENEFEAMNRALFDATAREGMRVAFNGHGGDALFAASWIVFADLVRTGRLLRVAREWRGIRGSSTLDGLVNFGIWPLLPQAGRRVVNRIRRGRRYTSYLERVAPAWFDQGFVRSAGLAELTAARLPRRTTNSFVDAEQRWWLTGQHSARLVGIAAEYGVSTGVELRQPLLDQRVVRFALGRPWWELRSTHGTKHLLRRSMEGLLPASLLGPRPVKTGSFGGYLDRCLRDLAPLLLHLADSPALADHGIVNGRRFRRLAEWFDRAVRSGSDIDPVLHVQILATVNAELWIRAKDAGRPRETPVALPAARELSAV